MTITNSDYEGIREHFKSKPTLAQGQCCDLKSDDGERRIWVCRVPDSEGGCGVTSERLVDGRWHRSFGDGWVEGFACEARGLPWPDEDFFPEELDGVPWIEQARAALKLARGEE